MGVKTETFVLLSLLIVGGGHSTPVTWSDRIALQEQGQVGQPSASGPYETSWELVNVSGLVSGSYHDAWVIYPSGTEASDKTFPLLSFAHGKDAGGTALKPSYTTILEAAASFGFVIIAPRSCPEHYCTNFYKDQLQCITAAKEGLASTGLESVDWLKSVGIFGHSMGGAATMISAGKDGYDIAAAFFLHPYYTVHAEDIKVPAVHGTGSSDQICPAEEVKNGFDANPFYPKVFAEIEGATHLEPNSSGGRNKHRWDAYVPRLFMCHLNGDSDACDLIYGSTSDSLCYTDIEMTDCEVSVGGTGDRNDWA
mmetsp:Transcript_39116/g.90123  ORF Transcript_39116/g.90123 Transcript_39116/m.90123 type:complete len:310 (+) Transcript_39116:118-1047(+)|eukprot:CAMPEP_0182573644 /NCGR_PEP_ID=MMETSP1324-20130603/20336_1 /TAXON_ID=236786 /ORGANISM="Florenciella sp., Strain RCC1587" /LENGTH=309 /DNA_ID=CAMNT_0024788783 /DNA_START=118 /DNA_END=1047 /DNA_ORIENTATION=-